MTLALSMALFAAYVLLAVALRPRPLGVLSWSAGIPTFYGFAFLLLPLAVMLAGIEEPTRETATAVQIATAGIGTFLLANLASRAVLKPVRIRQILDIRLNSLALWLLIAIGSGSAVWSYFYGYFGLLPRDEYAASSGVVSVLGLLLLIANCYAWNAYFRERRFLQHAVISTGILLFAGVFANSKESMLMPIAIIILAQWATRRFPYKLCAVLIALYAFVAAPFVATYRLLSLDRSTPATEFAAQTADFLLSLEWATAAEGVGELALQRVAFLSYFATIVEHTGNSVPYLGGETFLQGIGIVMPRFLYPDKPDMNIGNWTGYLFGFVGPQDFITNVSPTFMGEFYMNFGLAGVIVGMLCVGVLATCVDRYLIFDRMSWTLPLMVYYVRWQESMLGHTILPFARNGLVILAIVTIVRLLTSPRFYRFRRGT